MNGTQASSCYNPDRLDFRRSLESGLHFPKQRLVGYNHSYSEKNRKNVCLLPGRCCFAGWEIMSFIGIIVYNTKTVRKTMNVLYRIGFFFYFNIINETAFYKFNVCKHLPSHLDCRLKTKHKQRKFSAHRIYLIICVKNNNI